MAHPVAQAKDALKAILNARTPLWDTVEVKDGGPTEGEDFDYDAFWFEPTVIDSDAWASLGAGRRRLEFQLGFVISVIRQGDDERDVEDEVWELYEDLCLAIKAHPDLNATVQVARDVRGRQSNQPLNQHTWQAAFVGSIACQSKPY